MRFLAILCLLALAACGADGEPEQPAPTDGRPGVPVTGDATAGISVGASGTRGYGFVTVTQGPFTLGLGF